MAVLTVGPHSTYATFANAMAAAMPGDTLVLEVNFPSFFSEPVTKEDITVFGQGTGSSSVKMAAGIHNFTLTGNSDIAITDDPFGTDNVFQGDSDGTTFFDYGGNDVIHGSNAGIDQLTVSYSDADATTATAGHIVASPTRSVTFDGIDVLHLTLGSGDNSLALGSLPAIQLKTGAGNDTVTLGDSTDFQIDAGAGTNHITVGHAASLIFAGNGDDTIQVADGYFRISAGGGNNVITTGAWSAVNPNTIQTGAGDDTIVVGAGLVNPTYMLDIRAGDGNNHVTVGGGSAGVGTGAGIDTIITGDGNDGISSGAGADTIQSGSGNDTVHGNDDNDSIDGGDGNDMLFGDAGDDTIAGGLGNDSLSGDAGNDHLFGGVGDDLLSGGGGDDVIDGGDGNDTADFANAATAGPGGTILGALVNLSLTGPQDTGIGIDTLTNIENLTGSTFADTLTGDANANVLTGRGGADTLDGGGGSDSFVYLAATDSNAAGADTINGFTSGSDRIDLSAVAPTAISVLAVNATDSVLFANTPGGQMQIYVKGDGSGPLRASDIFLGTPSTGIVIQDGDGASVLVGGTGNDILFGNGGDDTLIGYGGADVLFGGAGNDVFKYSTTDDSTAAAPDLIADFTSGSDRISFHNLDFFGPVQVGIIQQGGNSLVFATTNHGALQINVLGTVQGPDVLTGGNVFLTPSPEVGVTMLGDAGFNFLLGTKLSDNLFGQGGNDLLVGGLGADVLFGGSGADSFRYANPQDSTASAQDLIADFETGIDKIDLTGTGVTAVGIAGGIVFGSGPGGIAMQIGVIGTIALSDIVFGPGPSPAAPALALHDAAPTAALVPPHLALAMNEHWA